MILPRKISGEQPQLPAESRQIVVIGANGAGKSRFAAHLADAQPRGEVFRLSPLRALYGAYEQNAEPQSIDGLYARALALSPLTVGSVGAPPTESERLMALMLQEEMTILLAYKMDGTGGKLPDTKIDRVLALWREIFPDNDVLRHEGTLLFSNRDEGGASRSQMKLSAGEKLVLYYFGAVLYAPKGALIAVDSPEMFLHPSTLRRVWDRVESLRPDCTFLYSTHDLDFASTRSSATTIWVRSFDAGADAFDYDLLPDSELREDMYLTILGARRPVLFIEGDNTHSIDSKLYPLIFPDHTVRALGSCDRVIESTRVFNSLEAFHHLDSMGIVDRDRRSPQEIEYLRRKKIMVPEVAEIENMLMIEEVIRAVARVHRRDENRAFEKVKAAVLALFRAELHKQALEHTRHHVKHTMEHRIDGRFSSITKLEEHMSDLVSEINPRAIYEAFCREFNTYVRNGDYESVLKVYNQKSMIAQSNVGSLTGSGDRKAYVAAVLDILKTESEAADTIRAAIRKRIR